MALRSERSTLELAWPTPALPYLVSTSASRISSRKRGTTGDRGPETPDRDADGHEQRQQRHVAVPSREIECQRRETQQISDDVAKNHGKVLQAGDIRRADTQRPRLDEGAVPYAECRAVERRYSVR